ncbi:MAG: ATP-grasp domain-containing protein [bacterium]|nr:ATP-grasp domain-containing protein [bacterium]
MAIISPRTRVAVLRGGPSSEYEVSLKTGGHVLAILHQMPDAYEPLDVFISRDGEWHSGGIVHEPHRALKHVDVVFNALHGAYGEDGQVQKLLESLKVPFTGSGAAATALAMNKEMAKRLYRERALPTPEHELVTEDNFNEDLLIRIFRSYLHPVIVKPSNASGSLGVRLARTFHELKEAIQETFSHSPKVLVEEYIKGNEATCSVIEEAKGEKFYALLPACKSNFSLTVDENKQIEGMAKQAHEALGLRHYSGSDFIVTPRRKIYILETNSLPALHEDSLMHNSLDATGWRGRDFVDHVIKLAMC